MNIQWALRKQLWNGLSTLKYRGNKPSHIPVPTEAERPLEPVPFNSSYRDIPIHLIRVADRVPKDELTRAKQAFVRAQQWLGRVVPPTMPGLPAIEADIFRAVDEAYSPAHRAAFPAPERPVELMDSPDLASLAVKGPYAGYLERHGDGYAWDLRSLGAYEHQPGLYSLGVRLLFEVDEQRLRPARIESELGVTEPGQRDWELAKRIVLCAISTHTSLVRHFNWLHLVGGSAMAIATRNQLPASHPLCRLLWPHIYGTQNSNAMTTEPQVGPGGEFESAFSLTHRGLCRLIDDTQGEFRLWRNDPARDAQERGLVGAPFEMPSLSNWIELYHVFHRHAERYIGLYYDSREALCRDACVRAFVTELSALMPNGLGDIGSGELSRQKLAHLVAQLIYLATVQHELMGTFLWNYQLWIDRQPLRVYRDGRREPIDIYNRFFNANFILNVHRTKLTDDFSYLALDEPGRNAMRVFRAELRALDAELKRQPRELWKLYPDGLKANINA